MSVRFINPNFTRIMMRAIEHKILDLFKEPLFESKEVYSRLLRYFEEAEDVEIRYCEMIDERRLIDRCTAIYCMINTDHCYVVELYGLNIKIMKKIEGETARQIRNRIKEISNLSGDDALKAFNNLLHETF